MEAVTVAVPLPAEPWPILCPEVPGEESRLGSDPLFSASLDSSSAITSQPGHQVKVNTGTNTQRERERERD